MGGGGGGEGEGVAEAGERQGVQGRRGRREVVPAGGGSLELASQWRRKPVYSPAGALPPPLRCVTEPRPVRANRPGAMTPLVCWPTVFRQKGGPGRVKQAEGSLSEESQIQANVSVKPPPPVSASAELWN